MSRDKANERINGSVGVRHEKKSHTGVIVIIAIGVILMLVGVILFLATRTESEPEYSVVTADNVDKVVSQMKEKEPTPEGYYEVMMNTEWEFESGDVASSNAYVKNSTSNQNTVYFTISPKGDSETIWYTSPYIEVGAELRDIKLDTALPAGSHTAVITYHLVDKEFNDLSSVSLYMTITVKN